MRHTAYQNGMIEFILYISGYIYAYRYILLYTVLPLDLYIHMDFIKLFELVLHISGEKISDQYIKKCCT